MGTAITDTNRFLADILAEPAPRNSIAGEVSITIEFTIKRFVLALLLDKAGTVVPVRDVMPVLKNFQVEAAPTGLRVVATDLELSMIATTELVDVAHAGVAVFPAKKMSEIIRNADEVDVHIRVADGVAAITIGRTTWRLRLQGGDDYPPMPSIADVTLAAVDRATFASALAAVRYAACRDANRQSLNMVDIRDGRVTACDGSRFQQATIVDLPFACQIPIGAVDDLLKLLKNSDLTDIHIGQADHHLIFRLGTDVLIVAKLMAKFPDMESALLRPALANRHKLTADRHELIDAIKRVRIAADPETSAIAILASVGQLTVSARDKFDNHAEETVEAVWDGPDRVLIINHSYLMDLINMTGGPVITFELGDDTKTRKAPIMVRDHAAHTIGVVQQMIGDWINP